MLFSIILLLLNVYSLKITIIQRLTQGEKNFQSVIQKYSKYILTKSPAHNQYHLKLALKFHVSLDPQYSGL